MSGTFSLTVTPNDWSVSAVGNGEGTAETSRSHSGSESFVLFDFLQGMIKTPH
jgi:hypothetical protein